MKERLRPDSGETATIQRILKNTAEIDTSDSRITKLTAHILTAVLLHPEHTRLLTEIEIPKLEDLFARNAGNNKIRIATPNEDFLSIICAKDSYMIVFYPQKSEDQKLLETAYSPFIEKQPPKTCFVDDHILALKIDTRKGQSHTPIPVALVRNFADEKEKIRCMPINITPEIEELKLKVTSILFTGDITIGTTKIPKANWI